MRKARLAWAILGSLLLLVVLAAAAVYLVFRASLPDLDGTAPGGGLTAAATIERDALGVVTLRAANRGDLAWATGYAHGQDRFFQMDLARRLAAGELSGLFGAVALDNDKEMRVHRFRHVAGQVLERASATEREILERYAAGVNAGLQSLGSRPFEYWLLRGEPERWQAADSLLVVFAMYIDLTYSGFESEAARGRVRAALPDELYRFIYASGTEWDAPVVGGQLAVAPIPAASVYDLRSAHSPVTAGVFRRNSFGVGAGADAELAPGSNNWAVGGAHTASGVAIIANDMHLGLNVPIVWYRTRMQIVPPDADGPVLDLNGVTLPGTPLLVVGSNGHIAWGFTTSYGDWTDLVTLDVKAETPDRYATPDGEVPFEVVTERIEVRDREADVLEIRGTRWGPVVGEDTAGRPLVAAWTAHHATATNLVTMQLETARDVNTALDIAARSGIPPQNFVVADAAGSIGWTIMGQIPVRGGYDPHVPASWATPGSGWQGWVTPEAHPRIVNPSQGRIWTANARVVDGQALGLIGDGGYALGSRAGQIRDNLLALSSAREQDMLAIQLDDRVRVYDRWRDRLVQRLDAQALEGNARRTEARELVNAWKGHAAVDSAGFRIVRAWRDRMRRQVFASLTSAVPHAAPLEELRPPSQFEGPLWQLVSGEPAHLLDPRYPDWRTFELSVLDEVLTDLAEQCETLAACTWGRQNRARFRHPLSRAVPMLAEFLDMPGVELPGDTLAIRVQTPTFGASERFAVSPGRETDGYLHMPGGQSGHPLSPYYRAGFDAWVKGEPLPLLPGAAEHTLTLRPVQ
jgi:penicillin amidase